MTKTAFMVDGGLFRKRAIHIWGKLKPRELAGKLNELCHAHLKEEASCELYRIFYYDCLPSNKNIMHPLRATSVNLSAEPIYEWTMSFYEELKKLRKLALRFGRIQDSNLAYTFKPEVVSEILSGSKDISTLTDNDLILTMTQKGVDMRIGLDIASLAHKKQVNQVVLISGDSDFIPIAKYARREGIDFVLDSMGSKIKPELFEHLDAHRNLSSSV